jgi:hypothetical protein
MGEGWQGQTVQAGCPGGEPSMKLLLSNTMLPNGHRSQQSRMCPSTKHTHHPTRSNLKPGRMCTHSADANLAFLSTMNDKFTEPSSAQASPQQAPPVRTCMQPHPCCVIRHNQCHHECEGKHGTTGTLQEPQCGGQPYNACGVTTGHTPRRDC